MTDQSIANADPVQQLFDAKAATWAAKYAPDGRLAGRVRRFTAVLHQHVPSGARVLDLGCGTGELAQVMAASGWSVTACDISEQMLRRASASDHSKAVDWFMLDLGWRTLPFASSSFQAVVASSVLEYVADCSAVLGECARVLRPGGVLLCSVPNPTHPFRWMEWPVRMAASLPWTRRASPVWPSLDRYCAYLRVSRQRHSSRWWRDKALQAGLAAIDRQIDSEPHSPLRLLLFMRPDEIRNYK